MTRPIFENAELDGKSFSLNGNGGIGVLLFHGLTSTTVAVRPLAEYLNRAGMNVMSPLLPGHGTKPEDVLKVHRQEWLETAEQAYQKLKSKTYKIIVGGESMGGLLALHLARQHSDISGITLFAPAASIKGQWKAQFLAPFIKIIPKYYLDDASPTPTNVFPWQGYNVIPVPAVAQFYHLQNQVKRELNAVHQPVILFQGKKDATIIPEGVLIIYNKVSSTDKTLIWLENSGHTLLLGAEYSSVYQQTLSFIQRVTK